MLMNELKKRTSSSGGDTLFVAVDRGRIDAARSYLCGQRAPATPAPRPVTLPSDTASGSRPVLRYVPKHEELKYTFGGVPPVAHIAPGTRIVSWTEDCYDGAVTKPDQLPTKVQLAGPRQPADRTVLRGRRGARRHPRDPHREARAGARLRDLLLLSGVRGDERHRSHGDARRGPSRDGLVLPGRPGEERPAHDLAGRPAHLGGSPRAVPRLPRGVARARRGPVDDRAGLLRRKHGLPRGPRRQHGVPRGPRPRSPALLRRRSPRAWETARSSAPRSRAR